MQVHFFTFNDFEENTYILIDETTKDCIIIDPGCNGSAETSTLSQFITQNNLNPIRLINTHCHIDHILGNSFVSQKYNLKLEAHAGEIPVLNAGQSVAQMYGIPYVPSPEISSFLDESIKIELGKESLEILFCPGHSPASICLYNKTSNFLIAGDVLFHRSIGRTDLPGGDHDTLIKSIREKLWNLPNETKVFPGHGISTNIGDEKSYNPFLNE
jgi:hydroxyacylglutathione hydrolase